MMPNNIPAPDPAITNTQNTSNVAHLTPLADKPRKTAQDWVRDLRMSAEVNGATVGVPTDRVTPDLLVATSKKLLALNRHEVEPDAKDSLAYQRVYSCDDYFAEHILRDAGKLGRNLLWKATNKGNLDFISPGALDQHVSDVFNNSKLANMVDGSSPLESVDAAFKITRIGEGGVADVSSAPDEMRLVQPSFLGYIDPVRCFASDTELLTEEGWKNVADITGADKLACLINKRLEYHHPEAIHSYPYDNELYGYEDDTVSYLVTPNHRMFVINEVTFNEYDIMRADEIQHMYLHLLLTQDPEGTFWGPTHYHHLEESLHFKLPYKGTVYCPTVPGGLVYARRNNHHGFWIGNSPESMRVGLDAYLTKNCMKGSDGKLYQKFINARTGKEELVDSVTAAKSIITTPDMMDKKTKHCYAVGGKTGVRIVNKKDVDYYLPRMDDAFSMAANLVTGMSGVKEMRLLMGCLHPMENLMVVSKRNEVSIIQAKDIEVSNNFLPGINDKGTEVQHPIRAVVSKFIPDKNWFRKIILYTGRAFTTSKDHRWSILKDNKITLVTADELRPGDKILRSRFSNVPSRRTFVNAVYVNKNIATLLGYATRSLYVKNDKQLGIAYKEQHKDAIYSALEKLGITQYKHYVYRKMPHIAISSGWFKTWLETNIGTSDTTRRIPSVILSSNLDITTSFLDAYTSDITKVGMDAAECVWILEIPNTIVRDGLAFLLARMDTDTYYRDSTQNGKTHIALKLVESENRYGDCYIDKIKAVQIPNNAPIMIDIDVNDGLYAAANGVITHNSKYPLQAIPIEGREAPLVRGYDESTGKDIQSEIGKFLGARYAPRGGTITAVRDNRIDLLYDDGTKGSVGLYRNFPMNAKGYINNTPRVKAGMRVKKGDLLASSNYTTDDGIQATGTNLRTGWISYRGGTYEDAIVLSESAAKKLTSTIMYSQSLNLDKTIKLGKNNYMLWKPGEFTTDQMSILDNDGVVKAGMVLQKGDPMVLAVQTTEPSPGTMGKRILTDVSETWEHEHPGVVTDIIKTRNGVKVLATVTAPLEVNDKISGLYGNKGIVSQILPDDQMPVDKDGKPLEMLLSPLGLVSRCYDCETEFLTCDGWKLGQDVARTDKLCSYNPAGDTWCWLEQLNPMVTLDHKGTMLGVCSDDANFLVTCDHRVWTKTTKHPKYYETTVKCIYGLECWLPSFPESAAPWDPGLLNGLFNTCTPENAIHIKDSDWYTTQYDGIVYCPSVASGYVVTRRKGKVICMGNCNPQQLSEALLGKVAHKTGVPEVIPHFYKGNMHEYVLNKLRQNKLEPEDTFYDPETNRKIPGVVNGYSYIHKLKHLAESKMSARGTSGYSSDETPGGTGYDASKRFGTMEISAMVSHGAFDNLLDNKLIRGQSNADFWRSIRTGGIPTIPGEPLVQRKFFAHLQGSGVNVRRNPKGISVFALSNSDVDELAGPRELKSRDTYETKNFRPMDGGLFGQDIFGPDGDRWAYIQLDEPLPNPVMEEPLARLLRMSDKDFVSVASGTKTVDGMSTPADIKKRLETIDLNKEAKQALDEFKNASPSGKNDTLKRYVAVERMRRAGLNPSEYMLDKLPVLPPQFRPISSHNGLTMVADANYLYAQLMDARNDFRDAKELPQEYQDKARANMYRTWKELVGLYNPEDVKLRNKNVGGLLKWALGSGSPKFSAFHRKVLGTAVDTVGRGAIMPNSKLTVDQIGIPINMAFDIMAPFIERKLVQQGYTPINAMKMVKKRDKGALGILQEVVNTHPVELNRAPTLHKYNIMAFKPVLVQGNGIQVHPSICPGIGGDFDGDTVNIHVPVSDNARKEALNKMLPSKNLIGLAKHSIMYKPEKEYMQGLYIATRMGDAPKGRAQIFRTLEEARDAYRQGIIDVDTPIQILKI